MRQRTGVRSTCSPRSRTVAVQFILVLLTGNCVEDAKLVAVHHQATLEREQLFMQLRLGNGVQGRGRQRSTQPATPRVSSNIR